MMTQNSTIEILEGLEIEVTDEGNPMGPVLVFAHGLGGNLNQWLEQFKYFGTKYRIISFSLQGHGKSIKNTESSSYTIEKYGDVVMALLRKRKISRCIWVGNSMGGVLGYEVRKRDDDLITHIITNGTAPQLEYSSMALKMIGIADKLLIALLGYESYIGIAVKASLQDDKKRKILKALFMQASPKAIICSHQILGKYDYNHVIKRSKHKTTFILTPADKDINKAIDKHRKQLDIIDNVAFLVQPSGGHVFNIERPEAYNVLLESIINE